MGQRHAAPHQLQKAPPCQQKGLLLAGQQPLLAPLLCWAGWSKEGACVGSSSVSHSCQVPCSLTCHRPWLLGFGSQPGTTSKAARGAWSGR